MAQPQPYVPQTSFIGYQAQQSWFPGQNLDVEFNDLKATTDQILADLALIQRDDGQLANLSVDIPQLSARLQAAFTGILTSTTPSTGTVPWVTPEQFGGRAGAGIDNTIPIQQAINAAGASSLIAAGGLGKVVFGVGIYETSNLTITQNTLLEGVGPLSVIKFRAGSTGYMIQGSTTHWTQLDNLGLDGGSATNDFSLVGSPGTRSAVHLWVNQDLCSVTRCYIHNFDNIAVGLNGDQAAIHGGKIAGNYFQFNYCHLDTGPSGVNNDVAFGGANGGEYVDIIGNTFISGRYGVISDSGNLLICGNKFIKNGYQWAVSGTVPNEGHGTFIGNICNHAAVYNVFTTPFVGLGYTIVGNQFFYGDWKLDNVGGFTITNNTISIITSLTMSGTGLIKFTNNWFFLNTPLFNTNTNTIWDGNWCEATQSWYQNSVPLLVDPRGIIAGFVAGTVGAELVTNGTFASGASWTTGTGWSIGAGVATSAGGLNGFLQQTLSGITTNTVYRVTGAISGYVSGSMNVGIGGAVAAAQFSANGAFTADVNTGSGADQTLYFVSNPFVGSIDNVSVKKFVSDGTLTIGHAILNTLATASPNTQSGTTYTIVAGALGDASIINNGSATLTLTLPAPAAGNKGQWLTVKTTVGFTTISASSNVVPLAGGAAGTAILSANAGRWVDMQSDGTNWVIMRGVP